MKKLTSLLFLLISVTFFLSPLTVRAESTYIKKVVSVVYDDSGSMSSDDQTSWGYANYAMQYFCGALNEDDQLFITYMSDYRNQIVPHGFDSNRQDAINDIQGHVASSGTPFESIEEAYSAFNNVSDYDDNTQFWLVIISDGNFSDSLWNVSANELDDKLLDISGRATPNGSKPMIQFLAIGTDITKPTERPDNNIFVECAENTDQIASALSGIADKVSGRYKTEVQAVDGKTIEFSSDIPLINIALSLQREDAAIEQITVDGQPLNIASVYSLGVPVGDPDWNREGIDELQGTLALINNGQENIPAGNYRVVFSNDISVSNVDILLEPALELRIELFKGDQIVTDFAKLYEGESVDVHCDLYEMGTENKIDPQRIPNDSTFSLTVSENDVETISSAVQTIYDYKLSAVETKIDAQLDIPGIAPITASLCLTPNTAPVYGIEVVSPSDISIAKPDLHGNEQGIHFVMTVDGEPANSQQTSGHSFDVTSDLGNLDFEVEQLEDGSFVAIPQHASFFLMFLPNGEHNVTGVLDGEYTAEGTVELTTGSWGRYVFNTLLWIIPLLIILWLLSVKHFMPCAIKCERVEFDRRGNLSEKHFSTHDVNGATDFFGSPIAKISPRFLAYILRESMDSFNGMQFKAGGSSTLILPLFFLRRGKIVEVIGTSLTDKIVSFSTMKKLSDEDYEIEYERLRDAEPRSQKSISNEPLTNRMMFVMLSNDDRAMFVYTVTRNH